MGIRVSRIEFIKLKQIEKELGTLAAFSELEVMKDGFKYSNSLIVRKATNMPSTLQPVPKQNSLLNVAGVLYKYYKTT